MGHRQCSEADVLIQKEELCEMMSGKRKDISRIICGFVESAYRKDIGGIRTRESRS